MAVSSEKRHKVVKKECFFTNNRMKKIELIELFSGIGGFTLGLQEAGFTIKKHYFSEIDKHAIATYKYNFPNADSKNKKRFIRSTSL